MSARSSLAAFLRTEPDDAGCDKTMSLMHVYVELILAGVDAARRYPAIAAHLKGCEGCRDDFEGLLAALSS
ncbi:hypothetical protein G3T36_19150 [Diaminobutyricibacter tongyongensis]|uniref:Zf-HC2 domain-containing protein n=1 Tax=Leifsonia tongyongensis TaxID=1268043 RepID=A0A6L9Y2T0_9MICO|nr:hypothetical protein [Diaminobutyricibacter tongyongensis]NEN07980.1 hypothetical protein [Diaminobutyricibacter tongyongensis]